MTQTQPTQAPTRMIEVLRALVLGNEPDPSHADYRQAIGEVFDGQADPAAVASLLTAIQCRPACWPALLPAARDAATERMLESLDTEADRSWRIQPILDTCGTGGDGTRTVNISTASAIVLAATGQVIVAKHGNRAASSASGSSDVLSELGIALDAEIDQLRSSLQDLGIAFLFAPRFHTGFRHVAPIRKQLPFRTPFNLLGPLINPARPTHQVLGVADPTAAPLVARSLLSQPGLQTAVVVHGQDGLDEVSLAGQTYVWKIDVSNQVISEDLWTPELFDLEPVQVDQIQAAGPGESAARIRTMLSGGDRPVRQIVLANAAAGLWVAGIVADLAEGAKLAAEAIDDGRAQSLAKRWASL